MSSFITSWGTLIQLFPSYHDANYVLYVTIQHVTLFVQQISGKKGSTPTKNCLCNVKYLCTLLLHFHLSIFSLSRKIALGTALPISHGQTAEAEMLVDHRWSKGYQFLV